jgi:hypothetical protein
MTSDGIAIGWFPRGWVACILQQRKLSRILHRFGEKTLLIVQAIISSAIVFRMPDIMSAPTRECSLLAIDIPSTAAALSDVKSQILDASILLPQIQEAFICFENVIQNSNYVEDSVHYEATALKQSAYNLALGMSEI